MRASAGESVYVEATFESILEAARVGAEWAWSRLYRDLSGPVLGYLRLRGAAEPEDLLGEVFLQVARNLATFQGDEAALRSWVFMIAHHRIVDERRRRSRRPVTPAPDPGADRAGGDAEQDAIAVLAEREVVLLLEQLSPAQRDVLLLRIVAGLTIDDIAGIVGKRPGAVKALQRRGLNSLRRHIDRRGVPL
jgi:RNA polymerase sigma-70 factor (ECF subfamily)